MCSKAHPKDGKLRYWLVLVIILFAVMAVGTMFSVLDKPNHDDCEDSLSSCDNICHTSWCVECINCNITCNTNLCGTCVPQNISVCTEKVCPSVYLCAECRNEYIDRNCDNEMQDYHSMTIIAILFGVNLALVFIFSLFFKYPCTDAKC